LIYAVVFFKDGQPSGVVSKEGHAFVTCHLFEELEKAREYADMVGEILDYSGKVFREIEDCARRRQ